MSDGHEVRAHLGRCSDGLNDCVTFNADLGKAPQIEQWFLDALGGGKISKKDIVIELNDGRQYRLRGAEPTALTRSGPKPDRFRSYQAQVGSYETYRREK